MNRSTMIRVASTALAALTLAACGAGNIVLRRPPALDTGTLGPPSTCGAGANECQSGGAVDQSAATQSGTRFLPLPSCPNGIAQIVITNVGPAPSASVQCAAASNTPSENSSDNPLANPTNGPAAGGASPTNGGANTNKGRATATRTEGGR